MRLQENSELQRLYERSRQQSSELVFFDDELKFFKNILSKYFLSKLRARHINKVQLIHSQLLQIKMVKVNVTNDALKHQGNLQAKTKYPLSRSFDFLKLENSRVEDEIRDLHKSFQNIKREIFTICKDLETDELVGSNSMN